MLKKSEILQILKDFFYRELFLLTEEQLADFNEFL